MILPSSNLCGQLSIERAGLRSAGLAGLCLPAGQQRPERLRLAAAGRFAAGDSTGQVMRELRGHSGWSCHVPVRQANLVRYPTSHLL